MSVDALHALVRRVAAHPAASHVVLRGGVVSRRWAPGRPAEDVDLLAVPPLDADGARTMLAEIEGWSGETEVIWAETEHPGLRTHYDVGGERVQLDVGFGDPLPGPTEPFLGLRAAPLETAIAWKLHGLFEREDGPWRAKDLHDLDLFTALPRDTAALRIAIPVAFASRRTPLALTDRLLEGELGRSRGSRRSWDELRAARPDADELAPTAARVADRLRADIEACHRPLPACGLFPILEHFDDVWSVVGGLRRFVAHARGALTVVNAEGVSDWPDPVGASPRAAYHRRIARECRGLVFGPDGALIARPHPTFFEVGDREETRLDRMSPMVAAGRPRVLEKLDGATITAGRVDGRVRLFTRRGPSPLASEAEAFLAEDPALERRVAAWVDEGYTPLFEWCARAHRIVLDYPHPRLVLTALRDRRTGAYVDFDALPRDIDLPICRGRVGDLAALVEAVRAEPEGEGVVLRFDDGQMFKLKTERYKRLHRAVEAQDPTRARWEVVLAGDAERLAAILPDPAEVRALAATIEAGLAREVAWVRANLSGEVTRRRIAERFGSDRSPRATCLRAAAAGEPVEAVVRRVAWSLATGAGARTVREWLGTS